jgi:hypothetical protein
MVFTSEHKKDSSLDRNGVFNNGEWTIIGHIICTVDGQIKLGQKWQSYKSKFTNFHRLITALSQIG